MSFSTFDQFKNAASSEKVGLVIMEAATRLAGWAVHSGSVYVFTGFTHQVITSITQDGTALVEVSSIASVTAGKYYYDRSIGSIYVRTSDSSAPDGKFMTAIFRMFFSNIPVTAPHDLATGFDVYWLPLVTDQSAFTYEIESANAFLGVSVSNTSEIKLINDRTFWDSLYDSVSFESHLVLVYSWERTMPITQASLLYKGNVSTRKYSASAVSFQVRDFLDEMRAPVQLSQMSAYMGARIPDNLLNAKQRRLYGYVNGHIPTPIDQVLPTTGYPLTGTFTVSNGGTSVTGSSTTFLAELSPGDDLLIGTSLTRSRIESITDNTTLVLSEAFADDAQTGVTATVMPSHPKRYANRLFLVAGHELSRPSVEVTDVVDNATFSVDSTDELLVGDIVEFAGSGGKIRVLGEGFIKLEEAFTGSLIIGSIVYRSSIGNVYLNGNLLTLTRDYSYDAAAATITLTDDAEFNVTPSRVLSGTVTSSNGSRSITGTSSLFRTELDSGSWIKINLNWYEVLEVVSDTSATLRTACSSGDAGSGQTCLSRRPDVYSNNRSVLVCDAIGRTDDSGNFLSTPGSIARDLLIDAGLEDDIDNASFTAADEILPHRLGLAIPAKMADRVTPSLRDTLNKICRSSFSSLVLNNDFQLEMRVLDPSYDDEPVEFTEADVIEHQVLSDSSNMVAQANVIYGQKEYDAASAGGLTLTKSVANDQFLSFTEKEFNVETFLIDEDDSEIMASRWAFLLSGINSDLKITTKLQGSRLSVFDVLKLDHEKLYVRLGSSDRTRIGAVVSLTKTAFGTQVQLNDLGNSFTRCARITDDDALAYDSAGSEEHLLNGYQTDENGITSGGITGINLIW